MNIRKRILLVLLSAVVLAGSISTDAFSGQTGTLYNYPHLYRGPRSMGMGGAFTAVGQDSESLFYNPAGLYDMGLKISVLNPLIEFDENSTSLASDIKDAADLDTESDRIRELTDIVEKNMGEPIHARAALFPNVAMKNFAVGFLGQVQVDARLHNPLGSSGAIEVSGGYEYGPIGGASFAIPNTGLRVGVGAKIISSSWISESFTVATLAKDDFDLMDYKHNKTDVSFDAGLLYDLPFLTEIKPKIGLSVLDITDLSIGESEKIPTRVNVGVSVNPKIPVAADLTLAADYQDAFKNYNQDNSTWKRIHLGAELAMLNRHLIVRAGLNQGYGTFGAEVDFWLIKLAYTYYQEEMGAYAGQDVDKRHMAMLTIGW